MFGYSESGSRTSNSSMTVMGTKGRTSTTSVNTSAESNDYVLYVRSASSSSIVSFEMFRSVGITS